MATYGGWMQLQEPVAQLHDPSDWFSSHADFLSPQHSSGPSLGAGSTPWLQHPHLPSHTMFAGMFTGNCPLMLLTWLRASNLPQEFELPNIESCPWSHLSTMGHLHLCFSWKNAIMLGFPHRIVKWFILKGTLKIVYFQPHDRKTSSPISSLKWISCQIHCQMLSIASYYSGFAFNVFSHFHPLMPYLYIWPQACF